MATSPNYAWAEPDNSSLVKNGASDIRTLGDAIDTSVWNVGFGQAGKNKIINGAMNVWQRGTSISLTNNTYAYGADRFVAYLSFSAGTASFSQQAFTAGAAPVAGYESQYFSRITCGSTSSYLEFNQRIEDVRTLAGQTLTFSFWAKSSAAIVIQPLFNQAFGSGGSATVTTAGSNVTLTSSWVRYTATIALPSITGKTVGTNSYLNASLTYVSGSLNSATIDIWGVQVEVGSKATPFQTATGTIQGELAACQRYFQRFTAAVPAIGFAGSTTVCQFSLGYKVPLRNATLTLGVNTMVLWDVTTVYSGGTWGIAASSTDASGISFSRITYQHGTGALTQFRPYMMANNDADSYIEVSAEL